LISCPNVPYMRISNSRIPWLIFTADAKQMMKLQDALDDNDDVQKVYANFDIDESEMESIPD
jgi:transcriptional/translational regulatory protein YebC/TACO1